MLNSRFWLFRLFYTTRVNFRAWVAMAAAKYFFILNLFAHFAALLFYILTWDTRSMWNNYPTLPKIKRGHVNVLPLIVNMMGQLLFHQLQRLASCTLLMNSQDKKGLNLTGLKHRFEYSETTASQADYYCLTVSLCSLNCFILRP